MKIYPIPVLLFLVLAVVPLTAFAASSENVEKAVLFLKTACVTSGSSLDIKVAGDGSLQVRSILGSGVKGSVSLTKKELEGFADAASALSAQQASEMRACMKPYIDRILSALLTGTSTSKKQTVTIKTEGMYFVTAEFDKVMSAAAEDPTEQWTIDQIANGTEIAHGKVRLYLEIASANDLGTYDIDKHRSSLLLNHILFADHFDLLASN